MNRILTIGCIFLSTLAQAKNESRKPSQTLMSVPMEAHVNSPAHDPVSVVLTGKEGAELIKYRILDNKKKATVKADVECFSEDQCSLTFSGR